MSPADSENLPAVTRKQARFVDQMATTELGIPSLLLMENAARAIVDLLQTINMSNVVFVCGRGNNGGDGMAAARLWAALGKQSTVLLLAGKKPLSPDAAANLQFAVKTGIEISELPADGFSSAHAMQGDDLLVVDCLLGTGFHGQLREDAQKVTQAINQAAFVLAVDVPSGLDCDSGAPAVGCVQADQTITFVAPKVGFSTPEATRVLGKLCTGHIGIPRNWVRQVLQSADKQS